MDRLLPSPRKAPPDDLWSRWGFVLNSEAWVVRHRRSARPTPCRFARRRGSSGDRTLAAKHHV